jgi:hypothetical protein
VNVKNLRVFRLLQRNVAQRSDQICGRNPEHFGLRILGIEPKQGSLRIGRFEVLAAAADFAEKTALRRQMFACLVEDAADNIKPVGSAVEGEFRMMRS